MSGERPAEVDQLHRAGFYFGPDADERCVHCPHRWGAHLLYPIYPENPLAGGTVECPDCRCTGTWSVDIPQWQRGLCQRCGARTDYGHDPFPHICTLCIQTHGGHLDEPL